MRATRIENISVATSAVVPAIGLARYMAGASRLALSTAAVALGLVAAPNNALAAGTCTNQITYRLCGGGDITLVETSSTTDNLVFTNATSTGGYTFTGNGTPTGIDDNNTTNIASSTGTALSVTTTNKLVTTFLTLAQINGKYTSTAIDGTAVSFSSGAGMDVTFGGSGGQPILTASKNGGTGLILSDSSATATLKAAINAGITASQTGISATAEGGPLVLDINGTSQITVAVGAGISATQAATTNNAGTIGITIGKDVVVDAGTNGIVTDLGVSSGTATVTLNGEIIAGEIGISQTSASGANVVDVTATGKIDPLIGIEQTTASGSNTVTNLGSILGDNIGVSQAATTTGTNTINNSGTITGAAQQGVVMSAASGAQLLTNTGTITGGTNGVEITSTSGTITFTGAAGTVNGGTNGLAITSTKAGAISVTGSNTITGAGGAGIGLTQSGDTAGTITLNTTGGAITGTTAGISATTDGTGAILLQTGGDVTATAGDGIVATNDRLSSTTAGSVRIDVAAGTGVLGSNNGILVDTNLANGGTRINVAGDVTGTDGYGILATNDEFQTGNNLGVNIQQTSAASTITGTLSGIRAEVLGASGPVTVNTLGTVSATGTMDAAKTRAAISVQSDATQGNLVTITTNLIEASGLDGINVLRNNGGGKIQVTANGPISSVAGDGTLLTGIRVVTAQGSTAPVGVALNSTIGSATDRAAAGIDVNTADGAIGIVLTSGSIHSTGNAITATQNGDTAGITVSGTGTGTIDTTTGDGISTALLGTVSGNVTDPAGNTFIQVAQTIKAGGTGINALTEGGGAILVNAVSNVTGGTNGIVLINNGPVDNTGTLTVNLSSAKTVTALDGDGIQTAANGAVGGTKITVNGSIAAVGGDGIEATSNSTRGDITITSALASTVTGDANAITAAIYGTGGDLKITTTGKLVATDGSGIVAVNDSLELTDAITIVATGIAASGGDGINATRNSVNGNIAITSNGVISSVTGDPGTLQNGIVATNNGGGDTAVTLNANIGSDADRAQLAGVTARQTLDDALGNVTINLNKTSVYTANGVAVGAYQSGDGTIAITETGTGTISSLNGKGVVAQVAGGGSANITLALTHNVIAGSDGITATTDGAGNLTVDLLGTVTATKGAGVIVTNTSATETASAIAVTTAAGKTISAGDDAIHTEAGAATGGTVITTGGNLTSTAGDGIDASSVSTDGDITITTKAGTTITALKGIGITASANVDSLAGNTGQISITNNAAMQAFYGIFAESGSDNATDAVSITNAGTIQLGLGGWGIEAYRYGGNGDVTVTNNAAISGISGGTFNTGIDAETSDGGNVAVTTTANIGTATGYATSIGIAAVAEGSGTADNVSVTVTGASVYGGNTGITATNSSATDTVAGNITVIGTGTGTISGVTGTGIYASQEVINGAGDVKVDVTQNVAGLSGIMAQTLGSGDVTVVAGGDVTATNGIGIEAQNTNTLANAGAINVTTAADTTVTSTDDAIRTRAGLATGGTVITVGGNLAATAGNGVDARSEGTNGDIAITTAAATMINVSSDFTGLVAWVNTDSSATDNGQINVTNNAAITGRNGIYAVSGSANTTDVVSVTNTGAMLLNSVDGTGIRAERGVGGGDVTVTNSAAISGLGDRTFNTGIAAKTSNGGDVAVTTTANIGTATGYATSIGIAAVADGIKTADNVSVTVTNASVYSGGLGIYAYNGSATATGAGDVTVIGTGAGTISGEAGGGIYAVQAVFGGAGNVKVDVTQNVSGASGIGADNAGGGNVTVVAGGNVTATNGTGIAAFSTNTTATTGAIKVTTAAGTTVTATGDAIRTLSVKSGGGTVIKSNSDLVSSGSNGIYASSGSAGGDITITTATGTTITSLPASGIIAEVNVPGIPGETGEIKITNGAAIQAFTYGIFASDGSSGAGDDITIINTGTIAVGGAFTFGSGIFAGRSNGSGDVTVTNSAAISVRDESILGSGITARTSGGGDVTVSTTADIGTATNNASARGIYAGALGSGTVDDVAVTVTGASVYGGSSGISAINNSATATGAGNVTVSGTGTGTISGVTGTGIVAVQGIDGGAGNVLVDVTQNVAGLAGISAETLGSGNLTVIVGGDVTATSGIGILAQNTNMVGSDGAIKVTTAAGKTVTAVDDAIQTYSGLASGGTVITVDSNLVSSTADGIDAIAQGTGGDITITTAAGTTISASTTIGRGIAAFTNSIGDPADPSNISITNGAAISAFTGIAAENGSSNGTGTITIINTGDLTVGTTASKARYAGAGILAVRTVGSGDVTVNNSGDIIATNGGFFADGIRALTTAGGDVLVDTTGSIGSAANYARRSGIFASASADVGTDTVTVKATGVSVYGGTSGISALNGSGGDTQVIGTGTGVISGVDGTGVIASQVTDGATGNVKVDVAQSVTGLTGIFANTAGTGNVTIEARGNVTGTDGYGIQAINTNTAANTGAIYVHNAAGKLVSTTGGHGIITDLGISTGTASVLVDGEVTAPGMTGVQQASVNGHNLLTVSATGKIDPVIGSDQATAGGSNVVINAGVIVGDEIGVRQTATTIGTDTVTNTGGITGTAAEGVLMGVVDGNGLFGGAGGTVIGGTAGLDMASSGKGNLAVNGSNAITGTNGAGVSMVQNGASAATITLETTGGAIRGTDGIHAQSNGTGAITIKPGAAITATAGVGIHAYNTGGAAGDVTVATKSGQTVDATGSLVSGAGIQSIAAGTGSVRITGTGNVTGLNGIVAASGTGALTIGGSGATTANGGIAISATIADAASTSAITIDRSGTITGGIKASNAGSGAVILNVSKIDSSVLVTGSQGATFGIDTRAGNGATTLTADGNVIASGIQNSICGNGLTLSGGSVAVTANSVHGCLAGISATSSLGNVTVASGTTTGDTGAGIVITTAGAATATTTGATTGNAAGTGVGDGINIAAKTGASVTVGAQVSGGTGIRVASTAGPVLIKGAGPVVGTSASGITAISRDGVTVSLSGTVRGASDGILAVSTGSGAVNVTGTGAITAVSGSGILAASSGGNVKIAPASTITASGSGIAGLTTGAGTVDVTTLAALSAGGFGIRTDAATGTTTITAAAIKVSGPGAVGIDAHATTGGIAVTTAAINGSAAGKLATAVRTNTAGDTRITLGAGTTSATNAASGAVIDASGTAAGGALTIDTTASALFGATGIKARSDGGFTIANTSIAASGSAFDLGGSGSGKVTSSGTITASGPLVLLGAGTKVQFTNNGTMSGPAGLAQTLFAGATSGNSAIANNGTMHGNVLLNTAKTNTFTNAAAGVLISGSTLNLGTCATCTLTNSGTLTPGNAGTIQTTALTGNLAQTSSGSYVVDYSPSANAADRVNATGTASVSGAVAARLVGFNPQLSFGTVSTVIMEAAGGLSVSEATLTGLSSTGARTYTLTQPTSKQLAITSVVDYAPAGLTANQTSLGKALNTDSTVAAIQPLANALVQVTSTAELQKAYNSLTGEGIAAAQQGAFVRSERFHAIVDREMNLAALGTGTAPRTDNWSLWISGDVGRSHYSGVDQTPGSARANFDNRGLTVGVGRGLGKAGTIGLGFGYGISDLDVPGRLTTGKVQGWNVGAYAALGGVSGFYGKVSASYDVYNNKLTRLVAVGGPAPLNATLHSDFDSKAASGRIELGYRANLGGVQLTPFVALQYSDLTVDGFRETGSPLAGLNVAREEAKSAPGLAGLQLNSQPGSDSPLGYWLRVGYRKEFERDRTTTVTFQSAQLTAFSSRGAEPERSGGQVSGGVSYAVSGSMNLFANGELVRSSNGSGTNYNGQAGLRIRF